MLSDLLYRLRALFRRESVEAELDEELRAHVERQVEKYMQSGMRREEAARRARLEFGGLDQVKEECREARGVNFIETTIQDVRYGLRQLRRSPGFTAVAIITLALGIGATTAIFSVVDTVLLHGTPYHDPAQLVEISAKNPQGEEELVTAGDFNNWQARTEIFQGLAAHKKWVFFALSGAGEPDEVWAAPVSGNTFHLLGVNAIVGRTFAANETQALVLSYEYWRSHFSGDPKIIGRTLALDGKPYTVIGIAPADLEFPELSTQVWVPLRFDAAEQNDHEQQSLSVIARLKEGVSLEQAQAAMDLVAGQLAMQYPKTNAGRRASVKPLKGRGITSVLRSAIFALLGAVVFVLMIVCANVASMLLARGTARQAEVAIRAALGAGRSRLIRQLLVESLMLAVAASLGGLVLAWRGLAIIVGLVPRYNLVETQTVRRIAINLPALGFTVAFALLTGIVVGLLPALRVSSLNINEYLKEAGRASATGARGPRLQRALVVSEVALALILLVGAGLLIQSFERLQTAPTGFNSDHLLTVRVPLVKYKYSEGSQAADFYRGVLKRIQAIPGVRSVAMANNLPFTGFHTTVDFPARPNSPGGPESVFYVATRSVTPGYFQTMGVPFKEGRDFTEGDNQKDARCVLIVNETMARRYWSGEDPVGRQVNGACRQNTPALIVGVVADSKQDSVDSQPQAEVYMPYAQFPFASFLVTFVVRTATNPSDLAAAVRSAVWEVDHDQPVIQMRTMENVIWESIWRQHVTASMLGIFAAIALMLAAVGVYGVLSYSVSRRTHEIGVRVALGATRRDILRMVMGEGLVLVSIGVGAGILGALALTRLVASLLYGVRPRDPLTFVALALFLSGVAVLAMYVPARRATKVDPMVALRYE